MAESENYTSGLKHDRVTHSQQSPMEQDTRAEERLVVTRAVQTWHSPTPPCWCLPFLLIHTGKHHFTTGDGHKGSSRAISFSAPLTKKTDDSWDTNLAHVAGVPVPPPSPRRQRGRAVPWQRCRHISACSPRGRRVAGSSLLGGKSER